VATVWLGEQDIGLEMIKSGYSWVTSNMPILGFSLNIMPPKSKLRIIVLAYGLTRHLYHLGNGGIQN
jgi:hypothetical protein